MSDHFPGEPGQDDAALTPELARLDELLLAEGRRWRRNEPSTAQLERHVQALARPGVTLQRNEERMLSERNQALDTPAPQRPPSRWRGSLALVATVLLVAMTATVFAFMSPRSLGTGTGQHTAKASPSPGFTRVAAIQPKDTYLPIPANTHLSSLSFSSAHDGWAVGGIITPNQPGAPVSPGRGVLVHYHDGVWTAASNSFLGMSVDSVSMVSADDGWAVGHVNDTQADYYSGTVLLHYTGDGTGNATGGVWKVVSAPALVNLYPRTIHMFSPDSGYITGVISVPSTTASKTASNSENQRVAVGIYQQGVWKLITTPFADIDKVVMASAAEGWAVDYATSDGSNNGPTTLYHYLNGVWTKALSLPIFFGSMGSISLGSAVDVWVMGFSWCMACAPDTYYKPVIYHFNGSAWSRVNPPSMPNIPLSSLVGQSIFDGVASGVWLTLGTIGAVSYPGQRPQHTAMMWVNRGNGWMRATQPVTGASVFALTTDGNGGVWAIAQQSTTPFGPSVLYTQGNEWKVYGRSG